MFQEDKRVGDRRRFINSNFDHGEVSQRFRIGIYFEYSYMK